MQYEFSYALRRDFDLLILILSKFERFLADFWKTGKFSRIIKYVMMVVILFFGMTAAASSAKMPDLKSKEKLICEVVLCTPIGLTIPASRSKCTNAVVKWSAYVASLGFLKKPPKCPIFNGQGQRIGSAKRSKQVCNYSEEPDVCNEAIDNEEFDMTSPRVCELLPSKTVSDRRLKQKCLDNLESYQSGKG